MYLSKQMEVFKSTNSNNGFSYNLDSILNFYDSKLWTLAKIKSTMTTKVWWETIFFRIIIWIKFWIYIHFYYFAIWSNTLPAFRQISNETISIQFRWKINRLKNICTSTPSIIDYLRNLYGTNLTSKNAAIGSGMFEVKINQKSSIWKRSKSDLKKMDDV